jgi:RimJ/RimL family protein N-acetyltransferase
MTLEELWKTPPVLEGRNVRLEPLSIDHVFGLASAGKPESIWKFMLYGNLTTPDKMKEWVQEILSYKANGTDLPFTVFLNNGGIVVGATRYLEMRFQHRSLEIGGTWYSPDYQRTFVNTECKYLLLKYAFEEMLCIRVQFKADQRNERSLQAIERLGAIHEGVLRNHYITPDGTYRNSVYFSILDNEWPGIKIRLEEKLKNSI